MFSRRITLPVAVGVAAIAVAVGAYGVASATSSSSSAVATTKTTTVASTTTPAKAGGNARSGPAAGGAVGKVSSLSKSSLTLTTSASQKVAVNESSSTKYQKGTSSISASAITKGEPLLVLGTANGTTIKATQIIVQTTSSVSATASSKVIPFKKGAPTTTKKVGQIPADYTQGAGTIVSGTTANKATEAGLAAYPGGIVDRVVKLSNGDYEVHNIGVNWPHHIFENKTFKVIGAE